MLTPTRRRTMVGGLLTFGLPSVFCDCRADANVSFANRGCLLSSYDADVMIKSSSAAQTFATGDEGIITTSGSKLFDRALAHTLSRITDVLTVLPGFAFYEDGNHQNAYATPAIKLDKSDGTVFFGLEFLRAVLSKPEHPDIAVAAICAHEFGHILQYRYGLQSVLLNGQPTVKRMELHADFLSGYYAGTTKLLKADYPAAIFATEAFSIGDNQYNDRNHHGTPQERAAAVVLGFKVAFQEKKSLNDALQLGVNYVTQ